MKMFKTEKVDALYGGNAEVDVLAGNEIWIMLDFVDLCERASHVQMSPDQARRLAMSIIRAAQFVIDVEDEGREHGTPPYIEEKL
jgi:hypothetical protein